jgi:hypothetical protein
MVEPGGVEGRELGHAGVDEKALEPEHAGVVQSLQIGSVAGYGATPEAHVDRRPGGLGGGALHGKRFLRHRRRDRVQRHVDDRGDPARRGRPCRRGEALPLGAARLVDVHVGVDQTG